MQTWSFVLASIPPEILYRLQCHSPHYHECEYKETKLPQCVVVDHRLHPRVLTSRPPILSPDIHAMFDGVKIAMDGMDKESTFSD